MSKRIMNTKELSAYLGINEKKIYTLITEKKLPATKITGKWIFLKDMVDDWLERSSGEKPYIKESKDVLMITGSDDILFNRLITIMRKQFPKIFPFFCKTGSLKGLFVLKDGKAHMAGSHLLDEESKEYNLPFIDSYLKEYHIVTVNFAKREQGILIKKGNPKKIKSFEDIARNDIRCINRQKGSGTRKLLDVFIKKFGISSKSIDGYNKEVTTHLEVGLNVLNNEVDFGLGIKAAAKMLDIDFIPLVKERFDIIIFKELFFSQQVQKFLGILRSPQFKKIAKGLRGYDTRDSGKIIYDS